MTENDLVGNLTVKEFRNLMQQCFESDRAMQIRRDSERVQIQQLVNGGMRHDEAMNLVAKQRGRAW